LMRHGEIELIAKARCALAHWRIFVRGSQ
jgi:hypothetical protein